MTLTFRNTAFVGMLNRFSGVSSGIDTAACGVTLVGGYTGGGDNFECYTPAAPYNGPLTGGNGWASAGRAALAYTGQQASDTFETYPVGALGTLSDGTGWSGNWVIR